MSNKKYLPAFSIGKIDNKNIFIEGRTISGDKAYEAYHLHLLMREILETRNHNYGPIPRIDRNSFIRLLIEISIFHQKKIHICELGSSLMEIIDGYELVKKLYFPDLKNENIPVFSGIEKSSFFNYFAKTLHPNHSFEIYTKVSEFPKPKIISDKITILIDRAVSSYAFDNSTDFLFFLKKFDIAILQIFGFKKHQEIIKDTIGKKLLYFNLSEINDGLENFYHFYGFKRPTRPKLLNDNKDCIEGFFLYFRSNDICNMFKKHFLKTVVFMDYFNNKINKNENLKDINIPSIF